MGHNDELPGKALEKAARNVHTHEGASVHVRIW